LGIDTLARYAKSFGLGRPTEIPLSDEKPGLIPSSNWKKKVRDEVWYKGETLSCAIGQGYILVTPIQLLNAMSALSNGGMLYLPQIVERIETANGKVVKSYPPIPTGTISLSPENLTIIRDALYGVVNEPRGTGRVSRIRGMTVSGKTGTAQVISLKDDVDEKETPYEHRDHAWFVAYAPAENPVISVAVLVEHGGRFRFRPHRQRGHEKVSPYHQGGGEVHRSYRSEKGGGFPQFTGFHSMTEPGGLGT
jgi:penicillin-binding protein 2